MRTLEWKSPNFRYVDVFAKHNYNNSVGQLMKPSAQPQPPAQPRPATFGDSEVGVALGVRERLTPAPEDLRREYRYVIKVENMFFTKAAGSGTCQKCSPGMCLLHRPLYKVNRPGSATTYVNRAICI